MTLLIPKMKLICLAFHLPFAEELKTQMAVGIKNLLRSTSCSKERGSANDGCFWWKGQGFNFRITKKAVEDKYFLFHTRLHDCNFNVSGLCETSE